MEAFMENDFDATSTYSHTSSNENTTNTPHLPSIIRVSARSHSKAVAGAIAGMMREHHTAEVQAIGAGAINQAVKALAISRSYLEEDDIDIMFLPCFTEVNIEGKERTAIRFSVRLHNEN
jgi:stage V sporulation protein S